MKTDNTTEKSTRTGLLVVITMFMLLLATGINNYTRQHRVPSETPADTVAVCDTTAADTVLIDTLQFSKVNFYWFCNENEIMFPDIVWAQARHESGNFTSYLYRTKNNFLGLYNSRIKDYYTFDNWTDCLLGYKNLVQYKYTGQEDDITEYVRWLDTMGYAEDPEYITKLDRMLRSEGLDLALKD